MTRVTEVSRFELTTHQLESLLGVEQGTQIRISRSVGPSREISCTVTRSESGGRHLYVAIPNDPTHELHVARTGNLMVVGALE